MKALLIIVAVVVVLAAIALALRARQRGHDRRLRYRFGPEYDRVLDESGRPKDARRVLAERQQRRDDLDIRPLPAELRNRYVDEWTALQSRFVDEPLAAVDEADVLVIKVMRDRGYPMDDFDDRADLISVDYPEIVSDYRFAHAIAVRSRDGNTDTDALRQAVLRYRSLFAALLDTRDTTRSPGR